MSDPSDALFRQGDDVMIRSSHHGFGPSFGLEGVELALWRCYEMTGADLSDGPAGWDWHTGAILAVAELRSDKDNLEADIDAIRDITSREHEVAPTVQWIVDALINQANAQMTPAKNQGEH